MRRFKCSNCGTLINVEEEPGDLAICPNCNTRQDVPPSAMLVGIPPVDPPEESLPVVKLDSPVMQPPAYMLMQFCGVILMLAGVVLMGVVFFGLFRFDFLENRSNLPWVEGYLGLVPGALLAGLGNCCIACAISHGILGANPKNGWACGDHFNSV